VSIYETVKQEVYVDGKIEVQCPSVIYCDKLEFNPYDRSSHIKNKIECWDDIKNRKVKYWTINNGGTQLTIKI
jgi:hypothetical protein